MKKETPDITKLGKLVDEYVNKTDCDHMDCDCMHYIFEEAVGSFYTGCVWDFMNKEKS